MDEPSQPSLPPCQTAAAVLDGSSYLMMMGVWFNVGGCSLHVDEMLLSAHRPRAGL